MSEQISFLERAIEADFDTAIGEFPNALRADEVGMIRTLSKDQLGSLLELRRAMEADRVAANNGVGVASM